MKDKKTSRRSRSRSRSRDRTSKSHGDREKDSYGTHREKDREVSGSTSSQLEKDLDKKGGSGAKAKQIVPSTQRTEAELEKDRETQKEEDQAILDDEMRKRRDRVKAWQDEKTKRIAAESALSKSSLLISHSVTDSSITENIVAVNQIGVDSSAPPDEGSEKAAVAAWNLEDDDDDDKEGVHAGYMDVGEIEADIPSLLTPWDPTSNHNILGSQLGSKSGAAVFDQMSLLKTRKMSIGGGSSPLGNSNASIKLEMKFDASSNINASAGATDISVLTKAESKTDGESMIVSLKTLSSSMTALPPVVTVKHETEGEGARPEFDPLDDFMSSLYGEGEVEEQRSLPSDNTQQRLEVEKLKHHGLLSSGATDVIVGVDSSSVDGAGHGRELSGGGDADLMNAQLPSDSMSVTDDDYDGYSFLAGSGNGSDNNRLNQFGSNFITLDQIIGSVSPVGPGSSSSSAGGSGSRHGYSSRVDYTNSGWESDSAPPSPAQKYNEGRGEINVDRDGETEDEREDREDKERKEFIDAIRAARAAEEVVRERLKQKEEAAEKSREQLGRVFAGEGDVMDENDIEEKKKSALEILEEAKKGKELKPIDHKSVEYISFRKNLYIVPRALSKLTEEDLTEKREDLQIKVRGKGCPAPVDTWGQCGLSERVLGVIEKLGLEAPFAIQKQAIPAIMCGRDLIGVAKTGSGKTLAFLLPMFRHIMDQPPLR